MSKEPKDPKTIGYLPDETPPFWKLILYALQQIIVMFPATILVALLTGFHLSTTIFASGLATLGFILVTKRKIPLYYGSSFSYLAAIIGLTGGVAFGEVLPDCRHLRRTVRHHRVGPRFHRSWFDRQPLWT